MKRFHVHVAVPNLDQSIAFYSKMFGVEPTVTKPDYAKWMLEDPRVNFAISARGATQGVNHLGFQVDNEDELTAMRNQAEKADLGAVEETGAACCYASSNKHWITDPAGIAWETFHTLGEIPVFGASEGRASDVPASSVCCPSTSPKAVASVCCPPAAEAEQEPSSGCCS